MKITIFFLWKLKPKKQNRQRKWHYRVPLIFTGIFSNVALIPFRPELKGKIWVRLHVDNNPDDHPNERQNTLGGSDPVLEGCDQQGSSVRPGRRLPSAADWAAAPAAWAWATHPWLPVSIHAASPAAENNHQVGAKSKELLWKVYFHIFVSGCPEGFEKTSRACKCTQRGDWKCVLVCFSKPSSEQNGGGRFEKGVWREGT